MQQILEKIEKYLKRLSKRDQIAMFVITFVAIIFLWDIFLRAPLDQGSVVVGHDMAQVDNQLIVIRAKVGALQKNSSADPDADIRDQLARYIDESKRLDVALKETSVQVVNPQEMTAMLEQVLSNQTDLKFVSLKNLPAVPEFVEASAEGATGEEVAVDNVAASDVNNINTIYRHSVVLEMEGSYHSMLAYLKKLEQFPWRFFWQGIEIETGKYPNSLIRLKVYTLGFREGIVGV